VFVLNEGERVRRQLQQMQALTELGDLVIADGGSTDGSLAADFIEPLGVRTLLTKTGPGRLSAQMRMAFAYSMNEGYEGVVVVDGNNKDGIEALPSFYAALDEGLDHVQGSRYVPGGKAINTPFLRHWGVLLLHAPLISLAARQRYTDTTNGFRAYTRRFLTDPRVQPFRDVFVGYELHYYLAIRAARLGFRVREIPVTRAYPKTGKTPTKISGWRGNWLVFRTLLATATGRFDPPSPTSNAG
jgi:glycosyltransferase involved in cell wall biosynthesis